MKRRMAFIYLCIAFLLLTPISAYAASDIDGHWAYGTIKQWTDKGYIKGYPDGTFKPNSTITRAEFVSLIYGAFNPQSRGSIAFNDVSANDWFYNAVAAGVGAGYVSGYTDNTFKPHHNISREEAAVVLCNLLGKGQSTGYADHFTDAATMSWSKGYVSTCVSLGILRGDNTGGFRPKSNMTRAEAVTCLNAALGVYNQVNQPEPPVTVPPVTPPTPDDTVGNVTITESTYGPSSGTLTVKGTATVNSTNSTTTLRNLKIQEDLIISANAKKVVLENCSIEGKVQVNGGTTLELDNSTIRELVIDSRSSLTVENKSRSTIRDTVMNSPATLNDKNSSSSYGFKNVTVSSKTSSNDSFSLYGDFDTVTVEGENIRLYLREGRINELALTTAARNSKVELSSRTTVEYARVSARSSSILGSGTVVKAAVNATGVTLARKPSTLTGSDSPSYDSSSGSGGGSSGSSSRYDYTIKVLNGLNVPVWGAQVTVGNNSATTNEQGEVTFRLYSGNYDYKITRTGFDTKSGSFSVSRSTTTTYTIAAQKRYTVTLNVYESGTNKAVSGAEVSLTGVSRSQKTTDKGATSFTNLQTGYYTATITKEGYTTTSLKFELNNKDTSVSQSLSPNKKTSFTLELRDNAGSRPLITGKQATVTFNGATYNTTTGKLALSASDGTYRLQISINGYQGYDSNILVRNGTATIPVYLNQTAVTNTKTKVTLKDGAALISEAVNIQFYQNTALKATKTFQNGSVELNRTELPPGQYTYRLDSKKYQSEGSITILQDKDTTLEINASLIQYANSVKVTDGAGQPVAGLVFKISGNPVTHGSDTTTYPYTLTYGSYTYTLEAPGYESISGSLSIPENPLTGTITMNPASVSFTLELREAAGEKPLISGTGISITFDGNPYTTTTGSVALTALPGAYPLQVDIPGYVSYNGTLQVAKDIHIYPVYLEKFVPVTTTKLAVLYQNQPLTEALTISLYQGANSVASKGTSNGSAEFTRDELPPGQYNYRLESERFEAAGTLTVLADQDTNATIQAAPKKYTYSLMVVDSNGNAINGSVFKLSGQSVSATADGKTFFYTMEAGDYPYVVEAVGFQPVSGTMSIPGNPLTGTLVLNPVSAPLSNKTQSNAVYSLRFQVSGENGAPLAGAGITINGVLLGAADNNGYVVISGLKAGNYKGFVAAEGYQNKSLSFSLPAKNNQAIQIQMEPQTATTKPVK